MRPPRSPDSTTVASGFHHRRKLPHGRELFHEWAQAAMPRGASSATPRAQAPPRVGASRHAAGRELCHAAGASFAASGRESPCRRAQASPSQVHVVTNCPVASSPRHPQAEPIPSRGVGADGHCRRLVDTEAIVTVFQHQVQVLAAAGGGLALARPPPDPSLRHHQTCGLCLCQMCSAGAESR